MKSKKINEKKGLSARPTRATGAQAKVLTGKRHKATANTEAGRRPGNSLPALYRKRSGVSLLLGLGIIFIMVFFSLLVSNVVVSSIRQSANVSRSNEAYFAAEGALEQGLLENFEKGAGYTSKNEPVTYDNTNLLANFQIQGTVPETLKYGDKSVFNNMYGVPTPGTGNVGANCDVKEPVVNQRFTYNTSTKTYTYIDSASSGDDPADHPCNWTKIKTGETVTIPLYYEDENGVHNLFGESPQEKLLVRLRTPCTNADHEFCATTARIALQIDNIEPLPMDDPILTWQVQGVDEPTGKIVALEPYIQYVEGGEIQTPRHIATEWWINRRRTDSGFYFPQGRFIIFDQFTRGKDITGKTGCMWHFLGGSQTVSTPHCHIDNSGANPWGTYQKIEKPVLKLSVIGNLVNNTTKKSVPHLEYQIITSANLEGGAPVNTSQTITAEGVSGTFKQVLQVNQPQAGGLPDYVVQQ